MTIIFIRITSRFKLNHNFFHAFSPGFLHGCQRVLGRAPPYLWYRIVWSIWSASPGHTAWVGCYQEWVIIIPFSHAHGGKSRPMSTILFLGKYQLYLFHKSIKMITKERSWSRGIRWSIAKQLNVCFDNLEINAQKYWSWNRPDGRLLFQECALI